MAAKLNYIYRAVWEFMLAGLGEFPDKIWGYHGCWSWHRSSSLKLQGRYIQMPAIPVAIDDALVIKRLYPKDNQGGLR